jgi:hypothetical protein
MRARLRLLGGLSTVLTIALLAPALVRAATVQDLVDLASGTYGMVCTGSADNVTCTGGTRIASWYAQINPARGQEDSLDTYAQTNAPLDAGSRAWMSAMHEMACGAPNKVAAFVDEVGNLSDVGQTVGPASIGTCTFTGGLEPTIEGAPSYHVTSVYVAPPPPTATPRVTPKPTIKPTPKPTPRPTPRSTPTPAPTEPATGGSVPPSLAPSTSPTSAPTPAAPTFVPTQEVAAATSVPAPSEPPPAAPLPPPPPRAPTFAASIVAVDSLNTDAVAVGGSLAVALLLLLLIGFAGELFNNSVESNYDVIARWFGKGPIGRVAAWLGRHRRASVLAFIALTALVSAFVDPTFGPDLHGLAEFLGFLVGLVVVLASFKLPPMLAHRRRTGELGSLRPLPWALAIAALFVLVSRLGNLQPGYLYGIVLGAIFVYEVSDEEEGRETFLGSLWTLVAALVAWLALTWVRTAGLAEDGFELTLLSTAFAAILVSGLEATAFGLMPMRFMPGYAVYRWNRLGWAALFGISVFAFLHILIGPTSGYVSELSPAAFVAALGVFAAFGALSIGTWLYFRFRRTEPEPA